MFKTIERLAGEKFQDNLNVILAIAGFESKTSIKSLSKPQTIVNLEKYINENRQKFEVTLKGTRYEHSQPFAFLPGHLAFLSGLPDYLVDLELKKRNVAKKVEKKLLNIQTVVESNEEIDTDENLPDSETIQEFFLTKIKTYTEKKNILIQINNEHILNFQREGIGFKCKVQCPACSKKISCKYIKNWIWPNLQSHLRKHSQSTFEVYEIENNTAKKVGERNAPTEIIRLVNENNMSLNSILNV